MKTTLTIFVLAIIYGASEGIKLKDFNLSTGETIKGYTFIGVGTGKGRYLRESAYFASPFSATYEESVSACVNAFGKDASLLKLESLEETIELLEMLGSITGTFWGTKYKSQSGNTNSEILEHANDRFKESRELNGESKFICELQASRPSSLHLDLVLVVESSSILPEEDRYPEALNFAKEVAIAWTGWGEELRLAFLIYSSDVQTRFDLHNELDQREMTQLIDTSPHLNGTVMSHLALDRAFYMFPECSCDLTPKHLVFMTSGNSVDKEATKAAAERFKGALSTTTVSTVGVGKFDDINWAELGIISTNATEYVYRLTDFARLKDMLKESITFKFE